MSTVTRRAAIYGLSVLTVINLFNYLDRYILAGVMGSVQRDFALNDTEGGLLATLFMVVYMCASPLGGFLGDRVPRRFLIGTAVLIWSAATFASGLATSFTLLIMARAATGIGEAGYGTVAPPVISDLFKKTERSRALSIFYAALPVGAAIGFGLGGAMATRYSWHTAFYIGGIPGLVLGIAAFFLPEPKRGAMDDEQFEPVKFGVGLKALAKNRRFWVATAGQTLMTFSIGGLSNWMPKFLSSERGFSAEQAGLYLGASTVLAGFIGTLAGGMLGDMLDKRRAGGGILLSAFGLILAAPMMLGAAKTSDPTALFGFLFAAQFCIFLNGGPLNAAVANAVSPQLRAFAFGISTLCLHLFGDASSPTVIGWISDHSSLGYAIELNALPVLLGGLVLMAGVRAFRPKTSPAATKLEAA